MSFEVAPVGKTGAAQVHASQPLSDETWPVIKPALAGTDGAPAAQPFAGVLHVTPPVSILSKARQRDAGLFASAGRACCGAAGYLPQVVQCNVALDEPTTERLGNPWSGEQWTHQTFQGDPLTSLRVLITDFRSCQEKILNRMLDQQQELHSQMSAMTSAFRATSDAQLHWQACQEERIAELCKDSLRNCNSNATTDDKLLGSGALKDEGNEGLTMKSNAITGSSEEVSKEFVEQTSSRSCPSRSKPAGLRNRLALAPSRTSELAVQLRTRVGLWLSSKQFELGVACTIFMNSLFMCCQSQHRGLEVGSNLQFRAGSGKASTVWPGAITVFFVFDSLFDVLFLLEMILKIVCWRKKYFVKGQNMSAPTNPTVVLGNKLVTRWSCTFWQCLCRLQYWNLLDFFCVVALVISEISKRTATSSVNPQLPRLLRLFRLGRLLRLLRYLEFLDHLYIMSTAIAALKNVMTGGIALLTLLLMTCDLFLVQFLHETYFDEVTASDLTEEQLLKHHEMYAYFGTWTRCMLSMFELTLANWPPVTRLLTEELSEWFSLLCLLHKLIIGFAIIGVINGVILQETFKVAQSDDLIMYRQKSRSKGMLRKKLHALFDDLDESGNGFLELKEIERISELPEIKTWLSALGIETDNMSTLFDVLDVSGVGHISCEEFLDRLPRIQGMARSLDVLALRGDLEGRSVSQRLNKTMQHHPLEPDAQMRKPSKNGVRTRTNSKTSLAAILAKVDKHDS